MSDQDSASDCETIIKPSCKENQKVDLSGNCVDDDSQLCQKQCPNSNVRKFLMYNKYFRVLLCLALVFAAVLSKFKLTKCAMRLVARIKQLPHSTRTVLLRYLTQLLGSSRTWIHLGKFILINWDCSVPGFIGDFKCTSSNENCTMYSVGKSEDGDFTYDYAPNPSLLDASGVNNKTTKKMRILRDL